MQINAHALEIAGGSAPGLRKGLAAWNEAFCCLVASSDWRLLESIEAIMYNRIDSHRIGYWPGMELILHHAEW